MIGYKYLEFILFWRKWYLWRPTSPEWNNAEAYSSKYKLNYYGGSTLGKFILHNSVLENSHTNKLNGNTGDFIANCELNLIWSQ